MPIEDNELLANYLLHEDKKLTDRTNIFTLAETVFLGAFVGLIAAPNGLPGLFAWFPIIICGAGIAFSIGWVFSSAYEITDNTRNLKKPIKIGISKSSQPTTAKANTKYELLPIGFAIAWILLLIVYSLHVTNAITF